MKYPSFGSADRLQRGFTLLELAMILVIASFLLTAIFRGLEMVDQARIKDTVNDFSGLSFAYLAYYDRYKAVPGDDANAGSRWAAQSARSGSGDGLISGNFNDPMPANLAAMTIDASTGESLNFWWHMRLSGFLFGPANGPEAARPPMNSVGGVTGVQTSGAGLTGLIVCTSNIPGKIALGAETMLDDQRPSTGLLRGLKITTPTDLLGSALTVATYVEDSTIRYVLCKGL